FESTDLNIHVPEGAIPKDGPSAGITMITSIVSTYTSRTVKDRIAMTGETTLRGRVTPVGGIKEKILAAKRAGITTIILCEENRKDIMEIKENYLEGLTFHYVSTNEQVLELALNK
ncbi:MAG: S16 family serine protease, partial [Rikenellaceae bacterium]